MDILFLSLIKWNTRWLLIGDQVSCKVCGRHQAVTDAHAFQHTAQCSANSLGTQYPGHELEDMPQKNDC